MTQSLVAGNTSAVGNTVTDSCDNSAPLNPTLTPSRLCHDLIASPIDPTLTPTHLVQIDSLNDASSNESPAATPVPINPMESRHILKVDYCRLHGLQLMEGPLEIKLATIIEVLKSPMWQQDMKEELLALEKNQMCTLVDPPRGAIVVSCYWVYKIKQLENGVVDCWKAHLVACGFSQVEGANYKDTYSLVIKFATI